MSNGVTTCSWHVHLLGGDKESSVPGREEHAQTDEVLLAPLDVPDERGQAHGVGVCLGGAELVHT